MQGYSDCALLSLQVTSRLAVVPARSGRTPHSDPEYQSSAHALMATEIAASYPYLFLSTQAQLQLGLESVPVCTVTVILSVRIRAALVVWSDVSVSLAVPRIDTSPWHAIWYTAGISPGFQYVVGRSKTEPHLSWIFVNKCNVVLE
jgi:hypothetical protein